MIWVLASASRGNAHGITPDVRLAPGACEFLPDRVWQLQYAVEPLTPAKYMTRLQQGWRRFGHVVFRLVCPACRMCRSPRVRVAAFRPNHSQRRAWKANQGEVTMSIAESGRLLTG